jgi:hypothetical protein
MNRCALLLVLMTAAVSVSRPVGAAPLLIDNTAVTIIGHFPSFPGPPFPPNPTYVVEHAIDAAGATTSYCTESGGTNTFVSFDFGGPTVFDSVRYSPSYPFCSGDVTSFDLIFSNVSNFSSVTGTASFVNGSSILVPETVLTPYTGRYLEWRVTGISTGSGNNGASDFQFYKNNVSAVPEPASLTLLGVGILGLAAKYRKRKGVVSNV